MSWFKMSQWRCLNEPKFKHGFNDTINPICICEPINHFFPHYPEYCEAWQTLFDNNQSFDKMLLSQNKSSLTHLTLSDDPKHNSSVNAFILNLAIYLLWSSGRLNGPLPNRASDPFSFFLLLIVHVAFWVFLLLCYLLFIYYLF